MAEDRYFVQVRQTGTTAYNFNLSLQQAISIHYPTLSTVRLERPSIRVLAVRESSDLTVACSLSNRSSTAKPGLASLNDIFWVAENILITVACLSIIDISTRQISDDERTWGL